MVKNKITYAILKTEISPFSTIKKIDSNHDTFEDATEVLQLEAKLYRCSLATSTSFEFGHPDMVLFNYRIVKIEEL